MCTVCSRVFGGRSEVGRGIGREDGAILVMCMLRVQEIVISPHERYFSITPLSRSFLHAFSHVGDSKPLLTEADKMHEEETFICCAF